MSSGGRWPARIMFLDSIHSGVGLAHVRRLILVNHRCPRMIVAIRVRHSVHVIILLVPRDRRFVLYGRWRARMMMMMIGRRMARPSTVMMLLPIEFRLLVNRGRFLGDVRHRWRRAAVPCRTLGRHVLGHRLIGFDRFVRGGSFRYRVRDGLIARQHHGPWHVATRQIRFRRPRQLVRVRLDGGGHFRVRTRRQVDRHSWRRRWNRDVLHVPVFLGSARRVHAGRYGVLLLYRLRLVTWVIFLYYRLNKLIVFGPLKII